MHGHVQYRFKICKLSESQPGRYASGSEFQREESWQDNVSSHLPMPEPWIGKTQFLIAASSQIPTADEIMLTCPERESQHHHALVAEIELTKDDFQKCLGKTCDYQENYLASAAKKEKVEVKTKDLNPQETELFKKAKEKDIFSWLATDTVRKILRSKIPEGQLLHSRWVLTWKPLDQQEKEETGQERKAKARLVILGYEDPMIDSLPRDSPIP